MTSLADCAESLLLSAYYAYANYVSTPSYNVFQRLGGVCESGTDVIYSFATYTPSLGSKHATIWLFSVTAVMAKVNGL